MEEIFDGVDDLIEQMRDLVSEGDITFGDDMMLREWLESVMFVGDFAGYILQALDNLKTDEPRYRKNRQGKIQPHDGRRLRE